MRGCGERSASFCAGVRLYVSEAAERAVSLTGTWAMEGLRVDLRAPGDRPSRPVMGRGPVPFWVYEEVPARGAVVIAIVAARRHRPRRSAACRRARVAARHRGRGDVPDLRRAAGPGLLARRPSASASSSGPRSTQGRTKAADQGRAGGGVRRRACWRLPDTDDSSFNWAAYLVPVGAVLVAAAVIAIVALRRWRAPRRRRRRRAGRPELSPAESRAARAGPLPLRRLRSSAPAPRHPASSSPSRPGSSRSSRPACCRWSRATSRPSAASRPDELREHAAAPSCAACWPARACSSSPSPPSSSCSA